MPESPRLNPHITVRYLRAGATLAAPAGDTCQATLKYSHVNVTIAATHQPR